MWMPAPQPTESPSGRNSLDCHRPGAGWCAGQLTFPELQVLIRRAGLHRRFGTDPLRGAFVTQRAIAVGACAAPS